MPGSNIYYYFYDLNNLKKAGSVKVDSTGTFFEQLDLSGLSDGEITLCLASQLGREISKLTNLSVKKLIFGPETKDVLVESERKDKNFYTSISGCTDPGSAVKYAFNFGQVFGEVVAGEERKFEINDIDLASLPDGEIKLSMYSVEQYGND